MTKPIMLLDVDGVLNVMDARIAPVDLEVPVRGRPVSVKFRYAKYGFAFMRWAWHTFDVHWMTCWEDGANMLATQASLPPRPVVRSRVDPHGSTDWKARAARRLFPSDIRPLVWLEDGISDEARAWIAESPSRLFVYCEPHVGVTRAHRTHIEEWLARMYGKRAAL